MLLDQPLTVVLVLELEQGQPQLLDGGEVADPEQLLLEGSDEALRNSIALGLAHEGGAGLDAEKAQLGLVVVAHELAAVVVAELEADADLFGIAAENEADALPDGFQRFVSSSPPGGMDTQAFGAAVVDGDEDAGLTLSGQRAGLVGTPHLVRMVGRDAPVVRLDDGQFERARRRQEVGQSHQPQHPSLADPDALEAELCPHLAIPLAEPGRGRDHFSNQLRQLGVAPPGLGSPLPWLRWWRCLPRPLRVDARAGYLPDPADQGQTIATTDGGRDGPAHVLDLRDAKGRCCFNLRASS